MDHSMREGDVVSFVGYPRAGHPAIGDQGTVMSQLGRSAHVLWSTGALAGQYTPVDAEHDIVGARRAARGPVTVSDELDDSLDVGTIQDTGMRHLCALQGPVGVMGVLNQEGLRLLGEQIRLIAEQAVREEGVISHAASQLDPDDADELIRIGTSMILRDAVRGTLGES